MNEFLAITKALSDEDRVRVLLALQDGELCACQLIELLGFVPGTSARAREDRKRLKEILKIDKEELCKVLRKN